jgi:hypothetical protein
MRIVEIGLWCVENDLFPLQVVENNILWPNVENQLPAIENTHQSGRSVEKHVFRPSGGQKNLPHQHPPQFRPSPARKSAAVTVKRRMFMHLTLCV